MRAHSSRKVLLLSFAVALGLTGCASSGGGGGGARPEGASSTRIVRAELASFPQVNLQEAVRRLRAGWLRPRVNIPSPMLYVDGARRGPASTELLNIRSAEVEQLEFMSSSDATTRYGVGHVGGAILVTMIR